MLNPKEREVSSLNGKLVTYEQRVCYSVWRELLQFGMITKHTRGWEIDERNLKSMNLTHFYPKRIENLKKSSFLVNVRFVAKTSNIRNFSQNIRSDVETSEVATLMRHINDIKFAMLQVRENAISLRKWSGGTAQLRHLRGNTASTP